jgi:IS5 family transposase
MTDKQLTLATQLDAGFERHRKTTKRDVFLAEMDKVVPWESLCTLIEPMYPKAGEAGGRPPIGLERMLRMYFLQHWYNLSDPAVEESLYDSQAMRRFVGIDLGREAVPDETTLCKFRHLLERNGLGEKLFEQVWKHLESSGFKVSRGTIVDATLIAAPPSTKNKDKARDPEMHQTRKGTQWYFGMKAHIGVDSKNKLIHSVVATAANMHDAHVLEDLLHGEETRVWGDSAYSSQREKMCRAAPAARDFTNEKGYRHLPLTDRQREKNRTKSGVRAKVEHVFFVIKRVFGFTKVRYRGLDKNAHRLFVASALANLFIVRRPLLRLARG